MRFYKHLLWLLLIIFMSGAVAHPALTSAVLIDIEADALRLTVQMPLDQLQLAAPALSLSNESSNISDNKPLARYMKDHVQLQAIDTGLFPMDFVSAHYKSIDNAPHIVVVLRFPNLSLNSLNNATLHYDAILHRVISHKIYVSMHSDFVNGVLPNKEKMLGIIRYQHTDFPIERSSGTISQGAKSLFMHGMQHILEGVDHLLFLLCLLLPAPLLSINGRWGESAGFKRSVINAIKVVTAFTIGHSVTLAMSSLTFIKPPVQIVEILVAASIIVAALYVFRPFVALSVDKVAVFFGLIHGMAFANTITELGLDGIQLFVALLSFNLGVETMQVLLVILVMPWLIFLARCGNFYEKMRWALAGFAFVAAVSWVVERAFDITNPFNGFLEALLAYANVLYGLLIVVAGVVLLICDNPCKAYVKKCKIAFIGKDC